MSTTKGVPKRHHYRSRFYLNKFTINNSLIAIDLKQSKILSNCDPINFCVEKHFNTVEADGFESTVVETMLSKHEKLAANAITALENGAQFKNEIKGDILRLITMFAIQSPKRRKLWAKTEVDMYKALWDSIKAQWLTAQLGTQVHDLEVTQELKDILPFLQVEVSLITTSRHISLELSAAEMIFKLLMKRSWTVIYAPNNADFITSEEPVMLYWKNNESRQLPRFALMNTQVMVPLTKKIALVGDFGGIEHTQH
ncbi:MAG: DUF4238 domain-containing protein, partial [Gammaproteobacteria bacterium]